MMNEDLAERYRRIPYAEFSHAQTHPGHVGAVARLYGLRPAAPRGARLLELATGRGTNLNWIAKTLPEAECLGVDLVAEGIENARTVAARNGLKNVTFETGDLLETDFGGRQFDYIIAHGFMAWTPEPVQQRILEVCRDHLAENGVALVSYNAMPGCATRDTLRRLFLLEMEGTGDGSHDGADADGQLAAMEGVMDFFDQTLPSVDTMPHAADLRQSLKVLRKKPREVLLHDEGGVVSEPLYLLQFTQWAAENGLAYLADTDLRLDWLGILPEPVQRAIAARRMPRLKALQYADYLRNTGFRNSLLCRADRAAEIRAQPDAAALKGLHLRSLLTPESWEISRDDSPARFRLASRPLVADTPQDTVIEPRDPLLKALLWTLAAGPATTPVPFEEAWHTAQTQVGHEASPEEFAAIVHFVLESVCQGRMKLTLGPVG